MVARFNHPQIFYFKITKLVFVLNKAAKFSNSVLQVEMVDIANFSDNTGDVKPC